MKLIRHSLMLAVGLALTARGQNEPVPNAQPRPFQQTLTLQGITFRVETVRTDGKPELLITPKGLEIDNSPIKRPIDGKVTRAEVADLNVDGSPEIYVYVTQPGKDARGRLIAYSANKKKSLSEIYLPELPADDKRLKGYRGYDEFAVLEGVFGRRFPIFKDGDSDDKPTGGTRQFQYKLKAGEAGWILRLDKTLEF